jgi:hypothetical protein
MIRTLFDLIYSQKRWSLQTFGIGMRTVGICRHIQKELAEIEAAPSDTEEWVDVILLAMDGYWRAGGEPSNLLRDLADKHQRNKRRKYPPIGVPQDQPIEHVRSV